MHIGHTSYQKSLKSPEHGENLVILILDQWISAGVFHARLRQVKGNLIISAACAVPPLHTAVSSAFAVNLRNRPGTDRAVKTYLLLKISAGRKSCRDYSPACYPACQPRDVSLCLSFHVKTLQVYSAFSSSCRIFPSLLQWVSSDLCCSLHSERRGPDQAPDQIGSAGGEVALCFLIRDGEAIHSLSTCLFLLVLCQSFRALFQPPLNIPLKHSVSAQNQRQADAEI